MKRTLFTIAGTLAISAAVMAVGGYAFMSSGIYDVSATTPDSSIVAWAVHKTSEASLGARFSANIVPAGLDASEKIAAGGALYIENCATCHGAPQVERTAISKGLNPQPPDLFLATRKPNPAENYQFIKHGVKMTGMPGFAETKTDDQIWSLVAFLNTLPGQSAADFQRLTGMPKATPNLPATKIGG